MRRQTTGIVLSGGGARGAYEVGVLSYILGDLMRGRKGPPRGDIVSGTSVGAANATFIAATAEDLPRGMDRLRTMWMDLELADVLQFGLREALTIHRVLLGGVSGTGLFGATRLAQVVGSGIDWRAIRRNQNAGHIRALTVTATHVGTGRPVVFVDRTLDAPLPDGLPSEIAVREERILPHHVLASASIPVLFAPVRIRRDLYCDGGLRLNTPMAPAIHMGADRLLVVGVSTPPSGDVLLGGERFPGATFLLGKVLNAFLLDHIVNDIHELQRTNELLRDGMAVFGPDFVQRLNARAEERGQKGSRLVRTLVLRPSTDISELAADYLRRHRLRFGKLLGRSFLRLLDVGEGATADLASYLLFDGGFARLLIDLGRADAAQRRDEIEAFLED